MADGCASGSVRTLGRAAGDSRGGPYQLHVTRDFTPYGPERDHAVGRRAARRVDGSRRHAVRRGAGNHQERSGDSYTGVSRRSAGPGGRTDGTTRSGRGRSLGQRWRRQAHREMFAKALRMRPTDAEARRLRGSGAVREFPRARTSTSTTPSVTTPGADRTSRMSPYLKLGVVHPRQLLRQTASSRAKGPRTFETELAWLDFYADVLHHNPGPRWEDLRPLPGMNTTTIRTPSRHGRAATRLPDRRRRLRQLLAEGFGCTTGFG